MNPLIPLFPLPSTVFFPHTSLPLHIFEPRYRQMVADTLLGDGKIGMVLLRPGWEDQYFQSPPIVDVGCLGRIEQSVRLDDGKYNIVLTGLSRFRVQREITGKPYRRAEVERLGELNDVSLEIARAKLKESLFDRFEEYRDLLPPHHRERIDRDLKGTETLSQAVDTMAYLFDMNTSQKQAFLEERDVGRRVGILLGVLDFKIDLLRFSKIRSRGDFDARLN